MRRATGSAIAILMLALPAGAMADKPSDDGPRNAAQQCRAERADVGVEAFRERHGANANKRNAFGKCVSQTVKAERDDEDDQEPEPEPEPEA